jgi:peptide/nickel transport system substrate-binding protein
MRLITLERRGASLKSFHRKDFLFLNPSILFGFLLLLSISVLSFENSWAQTKPAEAKPKPNPAEVKPKPERLPKLIIAQGTDASTMDAHHSIDSPTDSILSHMVETLVELTPKGEIVPKLAEKWEVSADATEFTLRLKRGIKFHDGQPFNAEAVKINFDRRLDPKAATKFGFLVAQIASVTVVDEYKVKFKTKVPFAPMLSYLTHTANGIQSPAALKKSWDNPVTMPIGSGPFIFKEWVPGTKVVMVQNNNYWGKKPALSEVTFRVIPDDASRLVALETGEVHAAVRIPPFDIPRLQTNPKITILRTPSMRTMFVGFNCLKEPFTDKRVRQALNYAVNKETILKDLLAGVGRVSDAPISPGIFGYAPIKTYEYNIEKAKAMLAEAGFPEGFETTLHPAVGRYYMDASVATAVVVDLLKVGVKAEIKSMEWGTYLPFILSEKEVAEHNLYILGWQTVTGDADFGLFSLFHSGEWPKKGMAASFYKNEKVDQLLELARGSTNPKERMRLYKEAMTLIVDDAPWIFLYSEVQVTGVRANVKGMIVHPKEGVISKEAWIE